ncbi:MAG TPA: hypothetical protein VM097_03350 [Mycobacteriales bacterium]|nr:hypothetical protein [Mycobacteriales bacterium]
MRRLLLPVLLVLLAAAPARAENAEQVAAALRGAPVYQAPGLDLVEVGTLSSELADSDPRVYLAVLPASAAANAAQARQRAIDIGTVLDMSDSVVLVITANHHFGSGQGDGAAARGVDSGDALRKEVADLASFTKGDLTLLVTSFAQRVANQAATPQPGVSNDGSPVDTGGGGGTGWLLAGLAVAVGGGGAALAVRARRRH